VAAVVDGVTKLDRLEFDSKEAQQAATIRKMFVAMAHDWRVLLIKLADRLHNMRTISVMPMEAARIAQETLDVYAPLAHRLGVQQVKWQLEDLSFATLHPKRYAEIEQMVAARAPEREDYLARSGHRAGASSTSSASRPRSPADRSTSGASTRRWWCGARSSTTSSTWWACA
jgi:GTP diphosphokinase / guanosine-3',5'-bis(diphosphate) 3'-diphosphatase